MQKVLAGKCTEKTIIQWFNYYRDVMTPYLQNNPVIFDNNSIVHIDETFIGGKRKYAHGRIDVAEPRWMLGLVNRRQRKIHLEIIDDKSHPSIIPIILRHINLGATIHTDGANVYRCLTRLGYVHRFVVHSDHLVDPQTGIHSNHIENIWSNLKAAIKRIRGSQFNMLDGHIDEYIYHYNRKSEGDIFYLLIADIARYHPV